jgi:uncharacterized protein (TIGR00375 family)
MTPFIFSLETGLSSDPAMNWRLSCLDKYALVSNSDAHSPSKIGREANVFDTDFSYDGLVDALKKKDAEKFLYTIEFFPEEGKYHFDGHRRCNVALSPQETIQHRNICPQCRRKLTVGVMHRVEDLADRDPTDLPQNRVAYKNLIPLNELIAQAVDKTAGCKSVWDSYFRFIHEFGNEQRILIEVPVTELSQISPERVGIGVERMRKGQVKIAPGHDGTFGKINLFDNEVIEEENQGQLKLF